MTHTLSAPSFAGTAAQSPQKAAAASSSGASAGRSIGVPRASPRLAEKVQRRDSGGPAEIGQAIATASAASAPATQPASTGAGRATPSPAAPGAVAAAAAAPSAALSSATSPCLSSASSTTTSPSMQSAIHTPLSKQRGSGGAGHPGSAKFQAPFVFDSPIALPPPMSNTRRKLLASATGSATTMQQAHPQGLPPSSAGSPQSSVSSRRASPMARRASTQGADGDTIMATEGVLLQRSVSCPQREAYHSHKLPFHTENGVSFISPRTAALLLSAHQAQLPPAAAGIATGSGRPTPPVSHLTPQDERAIREYASHYDRIHVLDARFPYEYEGGHIRGAVNVTSHQEAEEMFLTDLTNAMASASVTNTPVKSQSSATGCSSTATTPVFARPVTRALVASPPAAAASSAAATAGVAACTATPPVASSGRSSPPKLSAHGTGSRICILIHCEFSRHRGPKCFQFLRKRDREVIGIELFPQLHYPEMYVISGGYQAFFGGGHVALCEPREYVSMLDRRFLKEYSEAWKKMKKSTQAGSSSSGGGGGSGGSPSMKSSPFLALSPGPVAYQQQEPGSGGGSGNGSGDHSKPPGLLSRRNSRARSFSAMMDSPIAQSSTMINTMASTTGVLLGNAGTGSPGFPTRPLMGPTSGGGSANPSLAQHSPIPSHPRVSRGLSLTLDSSACGNANRRPSSAFTFHGSATSTSGSPSSANGRSTSMALGGTSTASFAPYVEVKTSTPTAAAASAASAAVAAAAAAAASHTLPPSTPSGGSVLSPSFGPHSFHPSLSSIGGTVGPLPPAAVSVFLPGARLSAPSPSPTYGWSMEGRSSTPSPFQGVESPRMIGASPLPLWNSPVPSNFGLNGNCLMTPIAQPLLPLSGSGGSGSRRATPMSLGDESPRSAPAGLRARAASVSWSLMTPPPVSGSKNPAVPTFDQSMAAPSSVPSAATAPAAAAHSPRVFASPQHTGARNLSHGFGAGQSQSQSPSSALHSMHLRSSPSLSMSGKYGSIYSPSASMTDIHRQHDDRYESTTSPSLSVCLSVSTMDTDAMGDSPMLNETSPSAAGSTARLHTTAAGTPSPMVDAPGASASRVGVAERSAKKRRTKSSADELLANEIPPSEATMRE